MIRKLIKLVFILIVLAAIGLAGYAYLGNLSPQTTENTVTVTLDAN